MTLSMVITKAQVREAVISNNVMGQLDDTSASLDSVVDAFWTWFVDTVENSLLEDIDHWALGPNGINTTALKIREE